MDFLVAWSLFSICLESVPKYSSSLWNVRLWYGLESFIAINFIFDILLKLGSASPCTKYLRSWTALADVLSVVPWIVESISSAVVGKAFDLGDKLDGRLNLLRLLRLLRFARFYLAAFTAFPEMRLFVKAVRQSSLAIVFLLFFISSAGFFFSILLYYSETSFCRFDHGKLVWLKQEDELCTFQNVFEAIWFVVVTITTVGYGDVQLKSTIGKLIAIFMMMCSVVGLSLPVAIFSANLTELYLGKRLEKKRESIDMHAEREDEKEAVLLTISKELSHLRMKLDSLEQKY